LNTLTHHAERVGAGKEKEIGKEGVHSFCPFFYMKTGGVGFPYCPLLKIRSAFLVADGRLLRFGLLMMPDMSLRGRTENTSYASRFGNVATKQFGSAAPVYR
jgi:hypothetical protein